MSTRKTAISVPTDLLREVDLAARERGESRSAFISRVLRSVVRVRKDAEITRRLNALFVDSQLADEQRRSAAELDQVGSSWEDERW